MALPSTTLGTSSTTDDNLIGSGVLILDGSSYAGDLSNVVDRRLSVHADAHPRQGNGPVASADGRTAALPVSGILVDGDVSPAMITVNFLGNLTLTGGLMGLVHAYGR